MLRQSFTDFIFATNTDGSGKAASYVRALDMLGPILTKHYPKPIVGGSMWHGFSLADIHVFSRSETRPSSRLRRKVLKTLRQQLVDEKVCVKLHLHYPLHAKLYFAHRPKNASNPIMSIMGSSNLTFSGMMCNGELNAEFGDYHDNQKYDHTVIWYDTNSWLMSA